MIVYHGANLAVEQPDTKHSNKYLDLGPGFYVTKYKSGEADSHKVEA